ncbi:Dabb family protein [Eudoraea chungangensis]|uniref:Dabb family protein n=1 Tax=Eudoraea chungangensis TaxID=1481905 RepID=UPI0023EDC2FB|nr:Dabb family protein [Eudoraea chungangensis]
MKTTFFSLVFLLLTCSAFSQTDKHMKDLDPAFVHNVYFWLKNPDSEDDQKIFEKALKKFLKKSKYAKTLYIGKAPKATRDVVDDSFTYALIVSFKSAKAQEKYQEEKPHLVFIEEASELWNKVIVYDSQGIKL